MFRSEDVLKTLDVEMTEKDWNDGCSAFNRLNQTQQDWYSLDRNAADWINRYESIFSAGTLAPAYRGRWKEVVRANSNQRLSGTLRLLSSSSPKSCSSRSILRTSKPIKRFWTRPTNCARFRFCKSPARYRQTSFGQCPCTTTPHRQPIL